MKKCIFIVISVLYSFDVFSECSGTNCTDVKITRMYVRADGNTIISTSGDESKLSCDAGSSGYISLEVGNANYNATYALLLTSHTIDRPVWIRTSDSGSCKLVYVVSDK